LHLSIKDNGKGLPDSAAPRMGSGLLGMTERLEMIGGRLSLIGTAGHGLQVDASLPL
jgi:signal transduction histidine kinase